MTSRRSVIAAWLSCGLVAGSAHDAAAYQTYGVEIGGRVVTLKWAAPVRYHVTVGGVAGVSTSDLQATVGRAFATWQGVESATASAQFGGLTTAPPFDDDGLSTLGFVNRPDLDRVLGATDYVLDKETGAIIESDIFFNASFPWSVAAGGETGKYDLESIALHEIGHLFGLGHSALGETELLPTGRRRVIAAESVMFPIAYAAGTISDRTLKADDIAGISEIYPSGRHLDETGTIVGQVMKNGKGVYGAHVVAFNPATGALVGGLTLASDGRFAVSGLSPGPHILRVEPLDDASLDSYFDDTALVDIRFQVAISRKFAIAPPGGASSSAVIAVTPK